MIAQRWLPPLFRLLSFSFMVQLHPRLMLGVYQKSAPSFRTSLVTFELFRGVTLMNTPFLDQFVNRPRLHVPFLFCDVWALFEARGLLLIGLLLFLTQRPDANPQSFVTY